MGAVDLVVQVESPPSVASGLQRIGRAGHQVGAVSRGVVLPKYRGDLVQCAVVAERMVAGGIESLTYPRNPLDVLAQQVVAMCALEDWTVEDLEFPGTAGSTVLRPTGLGARGGAGHAVRPLPLRRLRRAAAADHVGPGQRRARRPAWCAAAGRHLRRHHPRPRPVRRLPGRRAQVARRRARRGDGLRVAGRRRVPARARSAWRIEEISHDQVLVTPAPGQPGRMPYWHGDAPGRPIELGRALGAFLRELSAATPAEAQERLRTAGLDDAASTNLLAYLAEQREATGVLPDDRTILVERFRDELGDWRLAIHSPFGAQVNQPWAMAVTRAAARGLRRRRAVDALRRRHRAAAAGDRDAARRVGSGLRAVRDRGAGADRGRRLGAVRVALPRVRVARAAAPPPQPDPPYPAVAAAAAGRRSCSASRRSSPASRSSSRRCARCCRTSSTCPAWCR